MIIKPNRILNLNIQSAIPDKIINSVNFKVYTTTAEKESSLLLDVPVFEPSIISSSEVISTFNENGNDYSILPEDYYSEWDDRYTYVEDLMPQPSGVINYLRTEIKSSERDNLINESHIENMKSEAYFLGLDSVELDYIEVKGTFTRDINKSNLENYSEEDVRIYYTPLVVSQIVQTFNYYISQFYYDDEMAVSGKYREAIGLDIRTIDERKVSKNVRIYGKRNYKQESEYILNSSGTSEVVKGETFSLDTMLLSNLSTIEGRPLVEEVAKVYLNRYKKGEIILNLEIVVTDRLINLGERVIIEDIRDVSGEYTVEQSEYIFDGIEKQKLKIVRRVS